MRLFTSDAYFVSYAGDKFRFAHSSQTHVTRVLRQRLKYKRYYSGNPVWRIPANPAMNNVKER